MVDAPGGFNFNQWQQMNASMHANQGGGDSPLSRLFHWLFALDGMQPPLNIQQNALLGQIFQPIEVLNLNPTNKRRGLIARLLQALHLDKILSDMSVLQGAKIGQHEAQANSYGHDNHGGSIRPMATPSGGGGGAHMDLG